MSLFDISAAVAPGRTPTYPGDPGLEISSWSAIERGDPANVTNLHFGAHTGTHVDAPAHFIEGAARLPELPLAAFVGQARVVEIPPDVRAVEESHVAALGLEGAERVLFKTRNSEFWRDPRGQFREDFTYLTPEAARALAALRPLLVGWDYLSIEQFGSEDFGAHLALLGAGVVVVEGLDLSAVGAGDYELLCLPLRIESGHGDGAPARALLRTHD
ncbi:MAG TPA: cyclase family protein [Pyrinomonadaceae bacterium]|nr:cyclase family protein [Pyrinomonadaceae bacterium]